MSAPFDTAWSGGRRWYRGVRLTVIDHGDHGCNWIVTSDAGSTVDKSSAPTSAEAQQAAERSADRWASCPECSEPTVAGHSGHDRTRRWRRS